MFAMIVTMISMIIEKKKYDDNNDEGFVVVKVLSWNKTIFGNNPKLERFSMANNRC